MSWYLLSSGLKSIAVADTGAGGFFASSDPLLASGGWYTNEAAQDSPLPQVVVTKTSAVENNVFVAANEAIEYTFQFGVWVNKVTEATPHAKLQAIVDRLRTKYRRVAPTVTGWTASQIVFLGEPSTDVFDTALYSTIEAYCLISK